MFSVTSCLFVLLVAVIFVLILVRLFLYRKASASIYVLKRWIDWAEDQVHVQQVFRVPELNDNFQENQFYSKVYTYVNSFASIEDSDFTNLLAGKKSSDLVLCLDDNQTVHDEFLRARVSWTNEVRKGDGRRSFVLRIKKKDKRRVLKAYLQHIHTVSDEIEQRRGEMKLYMNTQSFGQNGNGRWKSVPFSHPSTLDTIAMDLNVKKKVQSDLESFLKSNQYYHGLGRVWKRSYLLYGPSGTGKSSFVAAMAKFLAYDVYDIDLSRVLDDSDLKILLLQTKNKSVIVIEDLDRFLAEKATAVSLSGMMNFLDGIVNSCCGDERVMVFTMNSKEQIDPAILRPGRVDAHIHFPLCNFDCFKSLANSYLGLQEHRLFPQVEEVFQSGAKLSPAEIGEIMIANRSSLSRALKTVIAALQVNGVSGSGKHTRQSSDSAMSISSALDSVDSGRYKDCFAPPTATKDGRKGYGLLRRKSGNRIGPPDPESQRDKR